MYVDVTLKVPDHGDWVALTMVDQEGRTLSLGYLQRDTFVRVADTLRPLHARVAEEGHPSADTVMAWEDFVNWVDVVAELGSHVE